MQLDLQSVEKYLSVRSHQRLPRKRWKLVFARLRMIWSFLHHLSRAVSRFASGPVRVNHRPYSFDPSELKTPI